jgi:hypothetical protein
MVPFWKLNRELRRFFRQPLDKIGDAATYLFGRVYYDRFLSKRCQIHQGRQLLSQRRAVYLIYPSNGLLPSHLRSLQYLDSKGICTTVVSNLPLSQMEKKTLEPLCNICVERPNFGYDFGGYRDGILSIADDFSKVEQLILVNDSVWFPISEQTDWLDDIDRLGVNFGAAASNFGLPRPDPAAFRTMVFDYRTDHRNFHYTSFALSFDGKILSHPGFIRFWKKFALTNKKKRVVRRGEIGLTDWVLKQGFTHGETLGVQRIESFLNALEETRLREIARLMIVPYDTRMQQVKNDLKGRMNTLNRAEVTSFILTIVARQGASYALAPFNIFELGFPFLKKSPLWLSQEGSDNSMEILEQLNTPAANEIKAEAEVLRLRL